MTTRPTGGKTAARKTPAQRTPASQAAAKPAARRSTSRAAGQEVDSPILPVDQLEALRKIKPGAVDWVIEQTQLEAEHRRTEIVRVNNLIFVEHIFAQASALILGVSGIWAGAWLANNGQMWIGVAIAAVVMATLAIVQVSARRSRP